MQKTFSSVIAYNFKNKKTKEPIESHYNNYYVYK